VYLIQLQRHIKNGASLLSWPAGRPLKGAENLASTPVSYVICDNVSLTTVMCWHCSIIWPQLCSGMTREWRGTEGYSKLIRHRYGTADSFNQPNMRSCWLFWPAKEAIKLTKLSCQEKQSWLLFWKLAEIFSSWLDWPVRKLSCWPF
jgi:hypothetical protein